MSQPISPKQVSSHGEKELPAYVSNGLIGLRVRDIPFLAGMALVSGFADEHPERRVEAAATAPYPLAGDLAVNGVWMSDVFHQACDLEQTYDFSAGELMSHFTLKASGVAITCEVLTFANREDPTLVCQEMSLIPSNDCDVQVKAILDGAGIAGRALRHIRDTPGESKLAGVGVGASFFILAITFRYVLEIAIRENKPMRERHDGKGTPLSAKVEQMLTEARVIIPGAQALLAFQLTVTLTRAFEQLPFVSKLAHATALCFIALSVILAHGPCSPAPYFFWR